jgi:hypothetical protein
MDAEFCNLGTTIKPTEVEILGSLPGAGLA